jgi:DNA-binding transcriptional LysR family regulator
VGTLASTRLTESIQTYRAAFPDVRLRLLTARSSEVTELVQRGEVDLGMRYYAPETAGIESLHIADEPMAIVCAAANPLAKQGNLKLAELSGRSWITFPLDRGSSGESFARELKRLLAQGGVETPELVEIDSLTAQKRLVELDFGIAIMPQSAVEEELRLGSMSRVSVRDFAGVVPVFLQQRKGGFISHAARGLAGFLTGVR